jgi:hypothetical protein
VCLLSSAALVEFAVLSSYDRLLSGPESPHGIVSLELAASSSHAHEIRQAWQRRGVLDAARASLGWDLPFVATYASALALGSVAAGAVLTDRGWPLGAASRRVAPLALLAGVLDVIEDVGLFREVFADDTRQPWPTLACSCAVPKFLLALAAGVYVAYGLLAHAAGLVQPGGRRSR